MIQDHDNKPFCGWKPKSIGWGHTRCFWAIDGERLSPIRLEGGEQLKMNWGGVSRSPLWCADGLAVGYRIRTGPDCVCRPCGVMRDNLQRHPGKRGFPSDRWGDIPLTPVKLQTTRLPVTEVWASVPNALTWAWIKVVVTSCTCVYTKVWSRSWVL